jgi:hypothetical protein
MAEERYDKSHHAGGTPEARIASRLRNSGGDHCDNTISQGSGPRRVFVNLHHSAGQQKSAQHSAEERREAAPRTTMRKEMERDNGR